MEKHCKCIQLTDFGDNFEKSNNTKNKKQKITVQVCSFNQSNSKSLEFETDKNHTNHFKIKTTHKKITFSSKN